MSRMMPGKGVKDGSEELVEMPKEEGCTKWSLG